MAAVFFPTKLSSPCISAFPSCSETLPFPRNVLQLHDQRHCLVGKSKLRFPPLSSSPFVRRLSHSSPEITESNAKGSEAIKRYPPSLRELIHVYRDAVLDGDEKAIFDIEAMISTMENEKISLLSKVSEISADMVSRKDKFLRLKADFDNFRKRCEKDRLTLTSDVQGDVIQSLLPMVDSFERVKQHIKPVTDQERKIASSYQGIYKQFVEILRGLHVSVVETVGKPFDPSLHEAIGREASPDFDEGVIIEEIHRGFVLGDKLLRPAMVKVSSGRKKAKAKAKSKAQKNPLTQASAAGATSEGLKQPGQ